MSAAGVNGIVAEVRQSENKRGAGLLEQART
jgi:hypothetical protein